MYFFEEVSKKRSIVWDFHNESNVLFIFFGGINGGLGGVPVFEFLNVTNAMSVKKMFIRDLNQAWYQLGITSETGKDDEGIQKIADLSSLIQRKILDANVNKVVMVGNSAGAFAALLFGRLLGVHSVHAFAPQTFLDKENRKLNNDNRYDKELETMYKKVSTNKYFDLKKVFEKNNTNNKTIFNIYFDNNDILDRTHAFWLSDFPEVKFNKFYKGGHSLIKELKVSGQLATILENSYLEI